MKPEIHKPDVKWCLQMSLEESARTLAKKAGQPLPPKREQLYQELILTYDDLMYRINRLRGTSDIGNGLEVLLDYVWVEQGRWTGLIDKPMFEAFQKMRTCKDIRGIFVPCDVMHFVFEQGIEIDGIPLRAITVGICESQISIDLIDKILPFIPSLGRKMEYQRKKDVFTFFVDCGQNTLSGTVSHDTPVLDICKWWSCEGMDGTSDKVNNSLSKKEVEYMDKVGLIIKAALMYYSCRPSEMRDLNSVRSPYVVPYDIPRSQRYQFKGPRDKFFRFTMPIMPKISDNQTMSTPTGRTVAMHFRNASLHVLKHPKWYQGALPAPGKFRTLIVKSCWVNAGKSEKSQESS